MMQKKNGDETPQVPIDKELVDKAVSSVVDLIIAALKSDNRAKFAEAARLCNVGQSLMRTQAKSVTDFAVLEVDHEEDGPAPVDGLQAWMGAAVREAQARPADERELRRNELLTYGPVAQIQAEAQRTAIASNEAAEMERLLGMRERVQGAEYRAINDRIRKLLANLETRNAQLQVVPADVSRRHPAGEGGPEGDQAPGVRADAERRNGHGGVAEAGAQENGAAQAVG